MGLSSLACILLECFLPCLLAFANGESQAFRDTDDDETKTHGQKTLLLQKRGCGLFGPNGRTEALRLSRRWGSRRPAQLAFARGYPCANRCTTHAPFTLRRRL